jgi:hypothetical protein
VTYTRQVPDPLDEAVVKNRPLPEIALGRRGWEVDVDSCTVASAWPLLDRSSP